MLTKSPLLHIAVFVVGALPIARLRVRCKKKESDRQEDFRLLLSSRAMEYIFVYGGGYGSSCELWAGGPGGVNGLMVSSPSQ